MGAKGANGDMRANVAMGVNGANGEWGLRVLRMLMMIWG